MSILSSTYVYEWRARKDAPRRCFKCFWRLSIWQLGKVLTLTCCWMRQLTLGVISGVSATEWTQQDLSVWILSCWLKSPSEAAGRPVLFPISIHPTELCVPKGRERKPQVSAEKMMCLQGSLLNSSYWGFWKSLKDWCNLKTVFCQQKLPLFLLCSFTACVYFQFQ